MTKDSEILKKTLANQIQYAQNKLYTMAKVDLFQECKVGSVSENQLN